MPSGRKAIEKREGLELSGTFIATLNAVLRPNGAAR